MAQQLTPPPAPHGPDLSDLVLVLLSSTLTGLRDRLLEDGFEDAADCVADLATRCDNYLAERG
jgi:hypothetical protein